MIWIVLIISKNLSERFAFPCMDGPVWYGGDLIVSLAISRFPFNTPANTIPIVSAIKQAE